MNKKLNFTPIRQFSFYPELVLLLSFLFSILNLNLVKFDSAMSLHLVRTFEWVNFNPSSWRGPEVADFSFRLIGPFYYWMTGLFWSFTRSIEGLLFINILFSYLSFYLLIKEFKKNLSLSGTVIWSFLFLLTPLLFVSLRQLENSALLNALCCLVFWCALKYLAEPTKRWLWTTGVIAALSLQVHLATAAPCLAFVGIIFIKTNRIKSQILFCGLWLILGALLYPLTSELNFLILPSSFLLIQTYEKFLLQNKYLRPGFIILTLFVGLLSSYFTIQNHFDQLHLGRALTSDMTLKLKKFIYSMSSSDGTDPFAMIHGRAVNQMRREEMNSSQTEAYYGLFRSLSDRKITYNRSIADRRPDSSWLFQLRNHHEMAIGAETPFLMTEIKPQSLPQNTVIKYLNEKSQGLEKIRWNNSNLILPFAFVSQPEQTKIVRLEFQLNSQTDKYLNILMDSEEDYKLLQVKFNKKVQAVIEHYPGSSAQQSQYIFKVPEKIDQAKVVVELKVLTNKIPNYSRLDIFTSGYLLASEF